MKKTGKSDKKIKAEIKIMLLIIYYTLAEFMSLMAFNIFAYLNFRDEVEQLFFCESTGDQEYKLNSNIIHGIRALRMTTVIVSIVPVVALLFTFNPKTCRKIKK